MKTLGKTITYDVPVAKCYTTTYYACREAEVVRSKTKGFYKFKVTYFGGGQYPYLGRPDLCHGRLVGTINKNYTLAEIRRVIKAQEESNKIIGGKVA